MINKKNVLGKEPFVLGTKDAIHVAIVAVRAGSVIKPGERIGLNEHREAVPNDKGCGVADPFMKQNAIVGKSLWMLLDQDSVPNVQHHWEHPSVDFSPPVREVKRNKTLENIAKEFGCTYEQLIAACEYVVENGESAAYPGTLSADELQKAIDDYDKYDMWSEWSDETGYEFENNGSECCPEYSYPDDDLFNVE